MQRKNPSRAADLAAFFACLLRVDMGQGEAWYAVHVERKGAEKLRSDRSKAKTINENKNKEKET